MKMQYNTVKTSVKSAVLNFFHHYCNLIGWGIQTWLGTDPIKADYVYGLFVIDNIKNITNGINSSYEVWFQCVQTM